MKQAERGDTVEVHYTGKLDDGTVFDSSEGREPLKFTIGGSELIRGFQNGVVGMAVGDSKTINVVADEAYGPHLDKLVVDLEREKFPDNIEPKVGQRLQLVQPDNRKVLATVTAVSDSDVTLDANHILAGKDLVFDIHVVAIL